MGECECSVGRMSGECQSPSRVAATPKAERVRYTIMSKKKKVRVELRKNRAKPPRENDLTRDLPGRRRPAPTTPQSSERVRAKGDLSRYRTVIQDEAEAGRRNARRSNAAECIRGRVLRVHGLASVVETDDGRVFRCAVRRLLKSLATDERSVVTTGDVVWFRARGGQWRGQWAETRSKQQTNRQRT